jgi:hypothetical protein
MTNPTLIEKIADEIFIDNFDGKFNTVELILDSSLVHTLDEGILNELIAIANVYDRMQENEYWYDTSTNILRP